MKVIDILETKCTDQDFCNAQQNAESRGTGLELAQRLNIAIDVAHAITYLHGYAGTPIKFMKWHRS
jgi:hypothetical protein